jgi:hypothetical protein
MSDKQIQQIISENNLQESNTLEIRERIAELTGYYINRTRIRKILKGELV